MNHNPLVSVCHVAAALSLLIEGGSRISGYCFSELALGQVAQQIGCYRSGLAADSYVAAPLQDPYNPVTGSSRTLATPHKLLA